VQLVPVNLSHILLPLIIKPILISLHAYLPSFAIAQQIRPSSRCLLVRRPWEPSIIIDDFDDAMAKHLVVGNGAKDFDVEGIRRQEDAADAQR
jgi:hypothetical protein